MGWEGRGGQVPRRGRERAAKEAAYAKFYPRTPARPTIVFCRRQAFYCCLKTRGSALTQPQKPGTALDACMHEQVGLFMSHKQPVKRAFFITRRSRLFVFCSASACPLHRYAGRQRLMQGRDCARDKRGEETNTDKKIIIRLYTTLFFHLSLLFRVLQL